MDKETVKRLAKQCGAKIFIKNGIVKFVIADYSVSGNANLFIPAFAQACCDWQKEKDIMICLNKYVDAIATYSFGYATDHAYNHALDDCADAIRNAKESPESDIEEARRTT